MGRENVDLACRPIGLTATRRWPGDKQIKHARMATKKELSPPVIVEPQLAAGSPTKSVVMHHSSERRLEVITTAGTRVAASFSLFDKGPTLSEKVE